MGLCKCPKRLVTNQFCFEHRVNVCEHCMVNSHPKCIIQSYIQWLKDSDYDSSCGLCKNPLEADDCVRLTCYHVFHWSCLNERESALPNNTAPGGHTCPTCYDQIIPATNLISPVADVLRSRLRKTTWGRDEFVGTAFADLSVNKSSAAQTSSSSMSHSTSQSSAFALSQNADNALGGAGKMHVHETAKDHSINMDPSPPYFHTTSNRRPMNREQPDMAMDRDEIKYKRRTMSEIFSRWSRRLYVQPSRPPWRRTWFIVLCSFLLFIVIIYLMAAVGRSDRSSDDSDPYQ